MVNDINPLRGSLPKPPALQTDRDPIVVQQIPKLLVPAGRLYVEPSVHRGTRSGGLDRGPVLLVVEIIP